MNKNKLMRLYKFIATVLVVTTLTYSIYYLINPCYSCQVGRTYDGVSSFTLITLAALTDSINPCSLAVLIIMLESLVLIRKKVIQTGLAFIAGIFISYLLIGMGLIKGISLFGNTDLLHIIIALIAILVGIFNIKDYFFYGKIFKMEIPTKWRPKMGSLITKASAPLAAFGIGFIISFFELPCTGGPYLFALSILKNQDFSQFLYLIYYNIIFVLPLVLIVLAIQLSFIKIEKTEEWRQKNIRLFHLITGAVILGIGSWLLLATI